MEPRKRFTLFALAATLSVLSSPAFGQGYPPYYGQPAPNAPQPSYAPQQIDGIVSRVALYPDPLLGQIMTAATFWDQIPDAAAWSRAHNYLAGEQLARGIQEDQLPWDPSVMALLPFPTVLNMMSGDMGWTTQLGNAVLADRGAVMDAVQRQRALAMNYGYLRSGPEVRVVPAGPGDIQILPVDPAYVFVPYYDPYIVFARPRPGFYVGGAVTFGPRVFVSSFFQPWGWGIGFAWPAHRMIVGGRPWERTWVNRGAYAHPFPAPRPRVEAPRIERHEMREYREPRREERPQERGREGRGRH